MRLIDADALLEKAYIPNTKILNGWWHQETLEDVKNAPTIEPKHGRWIKKYKKAPFDNSYEWVCSECGASPFRKATDVWSDETKTTFSNYCLNCGARMESE